MSEEILTEILAAINRQNMDTRLWRIGDVAAYMGLSKDSVYKRVVCKPGFPKVINIPEVGRRWESSEVKRWIGNQKAA